MSSSSAISRAQAIIVIIVIVVAGGAAAYFATLPSATTTSSTGSSTTTTLATTTTTVPTTTTTTVPPPTSPLRLVYEVAETPNYLDPHVEYFSYDSNIIQNVYEPLLWYNGTCSTCLIPWLAKSYTASSDGKTFDFTLRSGITFATGAPVDSIAVYFAFNKLLVGDGSTPVSHGTQGTWIIQQVLNTSISTTLSGSQTYGSSYVDQVLKENFIEITGPLTFRMHLIHPNAAFSVMLANSWGFLVDPVYVMERDLALWSQSSAGYSLPNPTLSGNLLSRINQYLHDYSATCNSGITPSGCGTTYLDGSYTGSLAGTGPYTVKSFDKNTNNVVLEANPTYWGGPYQFTGGSKVTPKIRTIEFKFVPDQATRTLDLQNAAKSGQAMAIDLAGTNLYDVADRRVWLNENKLVSVIPGVSLYGPYSYYSTLFIPFDTNVTNALTGEYYKFQPFADIRFRLAFADAVNMTQINTAVNNKLGEVAINVVPPGLPPEGSYNPSIKPIYSYDPHQVELLLVDAMKNPVTKFTFTNGTAAPPGFFDNTFGCKTLSADNKCGNPVSQSISLAFPTGDTVDEAIFVQIAGVVNNVSNTYNMGLTVSVTPIPSGQLLTEAFSTPTHLYAYALGWIQDYPWVIDFIGPMYAPFQTYPGPDGWNLARMDELYKQAVAATENGDLAALVKANNEMNQLANQVVMYLWTFYPVNFFTMTSNVRGFFFNPSFYTAAGGGVGPEYFATLY